MTRFVLLATQRSGSTWVMDMLGSHPAVLAYGELFLPGKQGFPPFGPQDRPYFSALVNGKGVLFARASQRARYLDDVYVSRDGIDAVGFKLMYPQARLHPGMFMYFVHKRVRIIHLTRRNTLDIVLSSATAAGRGMYHARSGEVVENLQVEIDPTRLVRDLVRRERINKAVSGFLRALPVRSLEVVYEDLAADPQEFQIPLAFLCVRSVSVELRSGLQKLNRESRRSMISNYESVARALSGTRFESMLDESEGGA